MQLFYKVDNGRVTTGVDVGVFFLTATPEPILGPSKKIKSISNNYNIYVITNNNNRVTKRKEKVKFIS